MAFLSGLLLVLVATQPAQDENSAADWACAERLIDRNYSQPVAANLLARRIHDECVRHFTPSATDPLVQRMQRNVYLSDGLNFQMEIEQAIQSRRLRDRIPLRR